MTGNANGSVDSLFKAIHALGHSGDLAAVIVHMNDTYLIQEKGLEDKLLPGLARVASLVHRIRKTVKRYETEDRTLVVHSGDYLSPSYLSKRCSTRGRQMIELMGHCGIDFATLGNHEFDLDAADSAEVLMSAISSRCARFQTIVTNLRPYRRSRRISKIALWPKADPFIAILGLAGSDTINVARKHGFCAENDIEGPLKSALGKIKRDPRIRFLAILSHLEREEDKKLQSFLHKEWNQHGFAYVLGGHDHHIAWQEPGSYVSLSKNRSNCATLTVVLITKSLAAAPPMSWGDPPRKYPSREEEMRLLKEEDDTSITIEELIAAGKNHKESEKLNKKIIQEEREKQNQHKMKVLEKIPSVIGEATQYYNKRAALCTRNDFIEAYRKQIKRLAEEYWIYCEDGASMLHDTARRHVADQFRSGRAELLPSRQQDVSSEDVSTFWILPGASLAGIEPCPKAQKRIDHWLAVEKHRMGKDVNQIVIDVSTVKRREKTFNCLDKELRTTSTNFGNFVADAVEIGAEVDLALIHAGMFRSDQEFDVRLKVSDLRETFLYDDVDNDGIKSIAVVELSNKEIKKLIGHASSSPGTGGFLQVSRGLEGGRRQSVDHLRVAIPSYLLASDQDGFHSLLLMLRKEIPPILSSHSIIDLVRAEASRVSYSESVRIRASSGKDDEGQWIDNFVSLMDQLISALPEHDQTHDRLVVILESPIIYLNAIRPEKPYDIVFSSMGNLFEFMEKPIANGDPKTFPWLPSNTQKMYRLISESEVRHKNKRYYQDYFAAFAGWIWAFKCKKHRQDIEKR